MKMRRQYSNHTGRKQTKTKNTAKSSEALYGCAIVANQCEYTYPFTFFLFERDEADSKSLRQKIDTLLDKYTAEQLGEIHRFVQFMVGL
ncbi:MAG: hypothetical protein WB510_09580 [Candidatus Sulfotelmatobacter sp.]